MKYYVRWIFVFSLVLLLVSFIDKDKATEGLNIGDKAPVFELPQNETQESKILRLNDLKGKLVLINFWATYDANSRMQNMYFNNTLSLSEKNIEMISISFDDYESIFNETIRRDGLNSSNCYLVNKGDESKLYRNYRLNRGFSNYLLNEEGIIIAKNISPDDLLKL